MQKSICRCPDYPCPLCQHSLAAEDRDAQCNLDDVDDNSACHGGSAGGDDIDEDDDCDAEVQGTEHATLKQKVGMFLHTIEVDTPFAPEFSAPDDEVVETVFAYGTFDTKKFHRMCDSNSGDYDVEFERTLTMSSEKCFGKERYGRLGKYLPP